MESTSFSNPAATSPDKKLDFWQNGPSLLRQHYFPRQRVTLGEAGRILGMAPTTFWRHFSRNEKSALPIRHDNSGRYVLLDDLISYLFGPGRDTPLPPTEGKKRGRPRKVVPVFRRG